MTESSGIGPLANRRRGVAPGTFLLWMILAAAGGAIAWDIYGNDVRSRLGIHPQGGAAPSASTPTNQNQSLATNANEIVGLVKDLQVSEQRTASDVQTALQLLTSEQAATKTLSDAVAELQAKVDALQRPAVPVVPAVKKPAPVAPRKPPAAQRPATANPEPDQPEPAPGAPTSIRPEGR